MLQVQNPDRKLVCLREVQKSLKDSSMQLIKDKIKDMGLSHLFEEVTTEIRSVKGSGKILFMGLSDKTATTIKSLEGMDCAWVEEAQALSKKSLKILLPTIRKEGSEVWFTWNPTNDDDAVQQLFFPNANGKPTGKAPAGSICIQVNYEQNPFASKALLEEAERCRRDDPQDFDHVWRGETEKFASARILKHWRVEDFETPKNAMFYFGADWGFSEDPTVLIRCFIEGRKLFIDYEAYEIGCEIDDTPNLFMQIPESERWPIIAGSDRPERIVHIRKRGFKCVGAVRGPGSIMDGIDWINNYDTIIHPRCIHTADEFRRYKHPIDPNTGLVVHVLPSKKNHVVEAVRYALENVRRFAQGKSLTTEEREEECRIIPIKHYWGNGRG